MFAPFIPGKGVFEHWKDSHFDAQHVCMLQVSTPPLHAFPATFSVLSGHFSGQYSQDALFLQQVFFVHIATAIFATKLFATPQVSSAFAGNRSSSDKHGRDG